MQRDPGLNGVISATRGNHGQSIALAASIHDIAATIVVPHGNSVEKNAAMRALGATLIEHGNDFQQSREYAARAAAERGLHFVPSFHRDLVRGVASYWMEFFEASAGDPPEVVFVPIGQGSGISACACARAVHGARTSIVGVVSAHATAYRDSFRAGHAVAAPVSTQLADGMACRVPDDEALALICSEVDDVITVTDDEVAQAMRALFADTHNAAEGAGAASLAGALQQRDRWGGRSVGITLCGANVDSAVFARVLAGAAA
jgi:threonine dehydratase